MDFNIPLAGSYNTRVGTINVIASASSIVGFMIVGVGKVGTTGSVTTKDQRFVNCFTERVINPFTQKLTIYLVKRPGFASALEPQAGSIGNAILIWTGASSKIISAFGATNSSIYDSTTQLVTNNGDTTIITGKARSITETVVSGTATITIASSDSTAWYYQPAGTVTKITDGDFPGNNSLTTVGGFAHIDGYACILDSLGQLWNSDPNSVTAWTATSKVSANSYPDAGIGCVRHGDKIVVFGTESTQFFYNAGLTFGSPFSRAEPLTLKVGCVSADAIAEIEEKLYWAGSSAQGGLRVYELSDSLKTISTPEIDAILLLVGASNISLTSVKFYGRSFVVVMAGSITWVYCVEEAAWHEWAGAAPLWYKCVGVSAGATQVTYAISKASTSGKIFTINPASMTFEDNSMAYSAIVQTTRLREGNRLVFWEEIEVIGDIQPSSSPLTISYTDDDYQTYTTLGTVDLADEKPFLGPCGSAFGRAWVLTHSHNSPMRISALAGRKEVAV